MRKAISNISRVKIENKIDFLFLFFCVFSTLAELASRVPSYWKLNGDEFLNVTQLKGGF